MSPRAVLIADVVGSSQLDQASRLGLDADLRILFGQMNSEYQPSLTGKFGISLGDEFQAVFGEPALAIRPVLLIHAWLASQAKVRGVQVRSSVGIGPVFVTSSRITRKQDGPAFHKARALIEQLHQQKQRIAFACIGDSTLTRAVNLSLEIGCRFVDSLWDDWTQPQWEAAYWKWTGKTSREVADLLEVRPQNISKRLKSSRFFLVDQTFSRFETILREPDLLADLAAQRGVSDRRIS